MSLSLYAKIPFQPGLTLGSIVRGDVIEEMEQYAQTLLKIEKIQHEIQGFERDLKNLDRNITDITHKKNKTEFDHELEVLLKQQQAKLQKKIDQLPEKIEEMGCLKMPSLPNISIELESPIDFDHTQITMHHRGFDSIYFNSQCIDMNESPHHVQNQLDQSLRAGSANISGSYGSFSIKAPYSWSADTLARVNEIHSQGYAAKIFLITALVTTRHVRLFKDIVYDLKKLAALLNMMKEGHQEKGITAQGNAKKIYMLTEAVMGGYFSAIVIYLKNKPQDSTQDFSSHFNKQVKEGMGFFKDKGEHLKTFQKANKSEDNISHPDNTDISIEFIAQGTIPQLAKQKVVQELLKHEDQNLKKYATLRNFQENQDHYKHQSGLQQDININMDELQTAIQKEENSIHTSGKVMQAYNDFCRTIVDDPYCGIPMGFNYTVLTENEIEIIIKELSHAKKP
ncbi:MAG: hypothetical protein QRY71_06305 [Candidatus Rhabdochlamydia sp.]